MSFKYSRYINRVCRSPWCITPEKFLVISDLMRERASGAKLSDEEIAARIGDEAREGGSDVTTREAIAVLPIHGTIAHRADAFKSSSGGASAERIGRQIQAVLADPSVTALVLDIDSPGGSVEGIPELATAIRNATASVPVVAQVNALAGSAAYWLASQADEIVSTTSGRVGSIGAFMVYLDESEALEKEGIKVNAFSFGENKLEGAPWVPMSDETRAHFQSQIDQVGREFVATVAKGRGITAAEVRAKYGEGRVFGAAEAKGLGMIDRIGSLDDTLARLSTKRGRSSLSRRRVETPGEALFAELPMYTGAEADVAQIVATTTGAGAVEIAEYPDRAAFTVEALDGHEFVTVHIDDEEVMQSTISLAVENGHAVYEVVGRQGDRIVADLQSWEILEPEPAAADDDPPDPVLDDDDPEDVADLDAVAIAMALEE